MARFYEGDEATVDFFEGGSGPVLDKVLGMLDRRDRDDVEGSLRPRRTGEGAARVRKPRSSKSK